MKLIVIAVGTVIARGICRLIQREATKLLSSGTLMGSPSPRSWESTCAILAAARTLVNQRILERGPASDASQTHLRADGRGLRFHSGLQQSAAEDPGEARPALQ